LIQAPNIAETLFEILIEEKENKDLVYHTLQIMYDVFVGEYMYDNDENQEIFVFMDSFVQLGICELLISMIEIYVSTGEGDNSIEFVFYIINELVRYCDETLSIFIDAGILNCLVNIYNSPLYVKHSLWCSIIDIVKSICVFDVNIIHQFNLLGIDRDSTFFNALPENLI
jgi:hypothetical protein